MTNIINRVVPNKPRSGNYPIGATIIKTGDSNINSTSPSGSNVDIIKENEISALTDKNVLSSLRSKKEIKESNDQTKADLHKEITEVDTQLREDLRTEIDEAKEVLRGELLSKKNVDKAEKTITFEDCIIVKSQLNTESVEYSLSDVISEDSNVESNEISKSISEEGNNENELSNTLSEEIVISSNITNLGDLSNVDKSVDTAPNGSILEKQGDVWSYVSDKYLTKQGDGSRLTSSLLNVTGNKPILSSGDKISLLFSKISNWLNSLKSLAFKDKVSTDDIENRSITGDKIAIEAVSLGHLKPYIQLNNSDLHLEVRVTNGNVQVKIRDYVDNGYIIVRRKKRRGKFRTTDTPRTPEGYYSARGICFGIKKNKQEYFVSTSEFPLNEWVILNKNMLKWYRISTDGSEGSFLGQKGAVSLNEIGRLYSKFSLQYAILNEEYISGIGSAKVKPIIRYGNMVRMKVRMWVNNKVVDNPKIEVCYSLD